MFDDDNRTRGPQEDWRANWSSGRIALLILIVLNALAFLFLHGDNRMAPFLLTVPHFKGGEFYRLFSSLFMHAEFFHLFFNMWGLFIFGGLAAPRLGLNRFLIVYFASGIFGNLLWLGANWESPYPMVLLGASGSVMGVIMASAMMFPNVDMFLLFIPFPIKLRTMAMVFVGLNLIYVLLGSIQSNVAYMAHLGGFLGGYLLMRIFYRPFIQWDPFAALFSRRKKSPAGGGYSYRRTPPPGWTVSSESEKRPTPVDFGNGPVTQKELDYLLDKVSQGGINALTEQELARLRQAREQMRGGQ